MINAVYRNRAYGDISADRLDGEPQARGALLRDIETDEEVFVAFSDPDLVVDPTDDVWFGCVNVRQMPTW